MTWTRGPTIGRGATAAVSLATTPAGDLFAVKSTDLSSSAMLRNEERFISQLSSPYVIRCLGSDVTHDGGKPLYNLFMEYSDRGSLSDFIKNHGGSLDEKSIRFCAHQLLLGIEYLHRNELIHCDIKPQNILIGRDGVKIADFGCAKWADCGAGAFSGTPAYMAPEVARGEEQSYPADVWALGCTVIEMATGTRPWQETKDPAAALYRIGFSGEIPEFPIWFSGEAKDFAEKCLMRDSKKRWTAAELLRHPFLGVGEGGLEELRRRSPSSVAEQGFWDAVVESSESFGIERTPDCPRCRMEALICNGDSRASDFGEEEEWVNVRTNEGEECGNLVEAEYSSVASFNSNTEYFTGSELSVFKNMSEELLFHKHLLHFGPIICSFIHPMLALFSQSV